MENKKAIILNLMDTDCSYSDLKKLSKQAEYKSAFKELYQEYKSRKKANSKTIKQTIQEIYSDNPILIIATISCFIIVLISIILK